MNTLKGYFLALAAVAVLTPRAVGQRLALRGISQPNLRSLSTPGGSLASQSPGLGGLTSPAPAGSDVLRSSIYSSSSTGGYKLSRSSGGQAPSGTNTLSSSTPRGMRLEPFQIQLSSTSGLPAASAEQAGGIDVAPYLAAMSFTGSLTPGTDQPITTFVPTEPGVYQLNMNRGDKAFRTRRYVEALGYFEIANVIASQAPEGELSVVMAMFATGNNYYGAVAHLNRALRMLPELPLVRLQLRGFYGNVADFVDQTDRLRQLAADPQAAPELLLLLAYVRYFDDAQGEAADLLRRAYSRAKDPQLRESIEIFWDGMVEAGVVSGVLTGEKSQPPTGGMAPFVPELPKPAAGNRRGTPVSRPASGPAGEFSNSGGIAPLVIDPMHRDGSGPQMQFVAFWDSRNSS